MNYSFYPEAKEEFFKAINYFEECQKGLGLAFSKEVFSTIQRIIHFPSAWSKFSRNTIKKASQREKVSAKFVMVPVKYQNNRSNCMVTDSN